MLRQALKGLQAQDLHDIIIDHDSFLLKLSTYNGMKNEEAKKFLDSVMNEDERSCLLGLLYSEDGWYRDPLGKNVGILKLIAFHLGFTNSTLSYNDEVREYIYSLEDIITDKEELILTSSYMKQKLVTFKTLLNRGLEKLLLYRGLDRRASIDEYSFSNLESWSENLRVAETFAKLGGYVIYKEFLVKDIFVSKYSYYYSEDTPGAVGLRTLQVEEEYIVENIDTILCLEEGINLKDGYSYR